MANVPRFEDLLPTSTDPRKSAIRLELIRILSSQDEIIPSATTPRGKLWSLVNSPKSTLADCAEIIQTDAALAARIFRVANSAAFGVGAQNINQAIQNMGLKFVREQVFTASVFQQYASWEMPSEWDEFWLRNIFVARLCEKIANVCGPTNGTEYIAGLIHDIGWLFLATSFPAEFASINTTTGTIEEAENEVLPFGHATISAAIAARSLMPSRSVSAILNHHHPMTPVLPPNAAPGVEVETLGFILKIADDIADCCGISMFGTLGWDIEQIQTGPEMRWLGEQGKSIGLEPIAVEELAKSKEIFNVYFTKTNLK
jgi:HD-like signal output (HDOD) protein